MGIAYHLHGDVLSFVTTGDVDYAEGTRVLEAGFAEAARTGPERRWGLLFDIRSSTENRSSNELRHIAFLVSAHQSILTGQCALVATDPLHFGLARMAGVYMESLGLKANVFHDPEKALTWLAAG